MLGIVETVLEDHILSSSPCLGIVDVLSSVMGEPGREESVADFTKSDQVRAKRQTGILD